jgi:gliding motility-associated-like protein
MPNFTHTTYLICLSLFISNLGQAQNEFLKNNPISFSNPPEFPLKSESWEKKYQERCISIQNGSNYFKSSSTNYILPVVIHIVQPDNNNILNNDQAFQAFEWLNDAYANRNEYNRFTGVDTKIQFCLAQRTPNNMPTNGIDRVITPLAINFNRDLHDYALKNVSNWNPLHYINIWVVPSLQSEWCPCAYNSYANGPNQHGDLTDGIVISAAQFGTSPEQNTQLAHEMGIYLGLYETFHGGCFNQNCLTDGDKVCDTPPDAHAGRTTCDENGINSCFSDSISGFDTDQLDLKTNFMDHYNHVCANDFTEGQSVRMEMAIIEPRKSLLESTACTPPCLTTFSVNFTHSPNTSIPLGSIVTFQNASVNANTWQWTIDGTIISTLQNPTFTFNSVGMHYIRLKATGVNPNCVGIKTDSILVTCPAIAKYTFNAPEIYAGQAIILQNQSIASTQWKWTVDGILKSTAQNYTFTPSEIASYEVCLEASNGVCSDIFCQTITAACPLKSGFIAQKTFLNINENVNFVNTSIFANDYVWSVDGFSQSTALNFNFSFQTVGLHVICLKSSNIYCEKEVCKNIWVKDPADIGTEICDNGLDDDLDGLTDCLDFNSCIGVPFCQSVTVNCQTIEFENKFGVRKAWQSTESNINAIAVPIVGNLDPQNGLVSEIIITDGVGRSSNSLFIFQGDGSDRDQPAVLPISGGLHNYPASVPALADIDRDGSPELIILGGDKILRVYRYFDRNANPPMQLWMSATEILETNSQKVYPADFNGDGLTELYVGNKVFYINLAISPPTLTMVRGDLLGHKGALSSVFAEGNASSIAIDLLSVHDCNGDPDCAGLEIAAGADIYAVDLDPNDGDTIQVKIVKSLRTMAPSHDFSDGYTSVADIDLDGVPEVLVSGGVDGTQGVLAWNTNGVWTFFANTAFAADGTGSVSVANVFDERTLGFQTDLPEIITANAYTFNCYNVNAALQNPLKPYWWSLVTTDFSGYTGATTFDFNGDRILEIVYRDEENLRIMYGGPEPFPDGVDSLRNWAVFPTHSITADEFPVIADVDGDSQAEIIFTGHNGNVSKTYFGHLTVLKSDEFNYGPWLSTRPIWNQYNYSVVNIEDNLSVPANQMLGHLELPTIGSGLHPFNGTLFQRPIYRDTLIPFLALPNANITMTTLPCIQNLFTVDVKVCNKGEGPLLDSLPITFYENGSPISQNADKIGTYFTTIGILKKDSCKTQTFLIPAHPGLVYAIFNDLGTVPTPVGNSFNLIQTECDMADNLAKIELFAPNPPLNLGPDQLICDNGVLVLHAGAGFKTYLWQDGSIDSDYTVFQIGTYSVTTTDNCGNVFIDSVKISIDPLTMINLGQDQSTCANNSIQLQSQDFENYNWWPTNGLSCSDCSNPILLATTSTTFFMFAKTKTGCFDLDTINVTVLDSSLIKSSITLCAGDSAQVFDNYVTLPGIYQRSFTNQYGCDSLHIVTVKGRNEPNNLLDIDQPNCNLIKGEAFVNSNFSDMLFSLNGQVFSNENHFTNLEEGNYTLLMQDSNGCFYEHFFDINAFELPKVLLPMDTFIELGASVDIVPFYLHNNDLKYQWSPNYWLDCGDCQTALSTPLSSISYTLMVTDTNGCTSSDDMRIRVKAIPDIYAPNVFSPNSETDNKTFTLFSGSIRVKEISWLSIFDRWGNHVFERKNFNLNDPLMGWDGSFNGKMLDPAVFVWEAQIELQSGKLIFLKGDVTLLR